MIYFSRGGITEAISDADLKKALFSALDILGARKKVLALPPDMTRAHSRAGDLTRFAYEYYGAALANILPTTGTHYPLTEKEKAEMFGNIPRPLFVNHDFRKDIVTLGEVPAQFVKEVSEGACDFSWPAQVNKLIVEGNFDLILSIGQVVPHEVVGMANYNKNILVGTGGVDGINKSHFLGAAYGMERMMGHIDTPVRKVLNYASEKFLKDFPIIYVQTVIGTNEKGKLVVRGLFIGDDEECFIRAAKLSIKVNFKILDEPLQKVVVHLDPVEFKSAWLCNKAIYRTRMAIADNGELIILAPGMKEFGEDPEIDRLIRKYGYVGTPEILRLVKENADLRNNLSAAAHLIHGSSEGRFNITYCPGFVTKAEIEKANYIYGDLREMEKKYDPSKLKDGFNTLPDGEKIYFISKPALGLWAYKGKIIN
jgi:nickel-dependent lactate racemase